MAAIDSLTPALVVADAGPLIHLDELEALDLLVDFKRILVPDAVWKEVIRHRPAALDKPGLGLERTAAPRVRIEMQAVGQLYTLHQGEWEALAVCGQYPGSRLLTDDTAARLAAKTLNISASGTLGIVLRALRRGLRNKEQIITLLEAIPTRTTLHLRPSLLTQIIAEVASL